ncbi:MAG: indolepyruvate ferredoxin oxidoreductase subunit alpha [Candidatus Eisenbacteria bacterium]|nr:indolepyruvate ferredoxin oxidoreductase subunit alpha [Candidatus Eisenbacteria bacterium]
MRVLLSGNEAVARGCYEHGVRVATAYPGTPSTEILESVVQYKDDIYCQWSPNEKVAFEVAMGASFGGVRTITAMKHVGLNVAADPLMTSSSVGGDGGFVIVTADDPGMHSSQNEQDNRYYAKFAKIPLVEPSDSQEVKDYLGTAFEISERFGTPVLFRLTTRISHAKTPVELGERTESPRKDYVKDTSRRVVIPAHARRLHVTIEKRLEELREFAETTSLNRVEEGDPSVGVVSSGIAYQYARDAFPDATFLKLGMSFPFPINLAREFCARFGTVYVVEENEPFIEEHLRYAGITNIVGKEKVPLCGELNQSIVSRALKGGQEPERATVAPRPPVLCPGCPHRSTFFTLNRLGIGATSDIGCYTLGVMPPLNGIDTTICMGASIGNALGFEKAIGRDFAKKMVAVIGDSTFVHSGMTGLADVAYNRGATTVIILDNSITAMTGHQHHPGTGMTLMGEPTTKVDYVELAHSLGIKDARRVSAYDMAAVKQAIKEATDNPEASLLVMEGPCALMVRKTWTDALEVDTEKCTACGLCLRLGCPAISRDENGKATINPLFCVGEICRMCAQTCPAKAISTPVKVSG